MSDKSEEPTEERKKELWEGFIRINEKLFEIEEFNFNRLEVLYAIIVGIFANVFTSYLIAFDITLFGDSINGLSIRVIFTGLVLLYFVWFYNNVRNTMERRIEPVKQAYLKMLNVIREEFPELAEFTDEFKKNLEVE
jgi:hypothetical protein